MPPQNIIRLVGLTLALSLLGDVTLYVILPTEYAQAGIQLKHVGLMLAANRLIRLFINIPYGILIETLPRRYMLIPSLLIGGIASLLYILGGFWAMLIGRLFWGAAWAGLYLAATTMVLDIATPENRGWLVGRLQMWYFIGIGLASLISGFLFDQVGYTTTFYISAGLIGIMVIILWFSLPETYTPKKTSSSAQRHYFIPARLWSLPLVTALLVYMLNWVIFIGITVPLIPVLLKDRFGSTFHILAWSIPLIGFTGLLTSINTVMSLISSPISGRISDRNGKRWQQILWACILGIIGLLMAAWGNRVIIILAILCNGFIVSILTTQIIAWIGDYDPNERGHLLGLMNTMGDLGGTIGPLLAFALLEQIGLDGLFVGCAVVLGAVTPLVFFISRQESPMKTI